MALNNPPKQTLTTAVDTTRSPEEAGSLSREEDDEEIEEEELEKLETEANEMGKKILQYRATLPDQLKSTLSSILSSQRPVLPDIDYGSDPGPAREPNEGFGEQGKSSKSALLVGGDQNNIEKVHLLKDKISSNISAMPIIIKRVKECTFKIDNLNTYNGIIHPAFKKKRTS